MILVVLENQRGKIHPFSIEALVAGQKFAKNLKKVSKIGIFSLSTIYCV